MFILLSHSMNVESDWNVGSLEVRFMPLGSLQMFLESLLNSFCVLGGQTSGGEPTFEYSTAFKG